MMCSNNEDEKKSRAGWMNGCERVGRQDMILWCTPTTHASMLQCYILLPFFTALSLSLPLCLCRSGTFSQLFLGADESIGLCV